MSDAENIQDQQIPDPLEPIANGISQPTDDALQNNDGATMDEKPVNEEESVVVEESSDETPVDETAAPKEDEPVVSSMDSFREGDPIVTPGMNWFVLRVASNKEDSVRETLLRKIKIEGFQHLVNRILVPTEKIRTMKGGRQKVTERKFYPGYVFVEMRLEDDGRIHQDVFFLIKETTGVGDFIGTAGRPAAMQPHEVEKMIIASQKPEDQPEVKMEFQPGDPVKIKEGPFENMDGTIDALLPEQGKVRVIVTIFGRATPIEMEYWLVEKAEI